MLQQYSLIRFEVFKSYTGSFCFWSLILRNLLRYQALSRRLSGDNVCIISTSVPEQGIIWLTTCERIFRMRILHKQHKYGNSMSTPDPRIFYCIPRNCPADAEQNLGSLIYTGLFWIVAVEKLNTVVQLEKRSLFLQQQGVFTEAKGHVVSKLEQTTLSHSRDDPMSLT